MKSNFVKNIYCAATHGVFSRNAIEKLSKLNISKYFITDSLPHNYDKNTQFNSVSIATLFGEAIKRIHEGSSVGELFKKNNI